MKQKTLLIMSCSATKNPTPEWIAAKHRYTGPLWQTLRASCTLPENTSLAVLSARYGLINAETMTQFYNTMMTPALADRMITEGISALWPKAPASMAQISFGNRAACEIAMMANYGDKPFEHIVCCGGHLYVRVMKALISELQKDDNPAIRHDATIETITDQIGLMRQKLARRFPKTHDDETLPILHPFQTETGTNQQTLFAAMN